MRVTIILTILWRHSRAYEHVNHHLGGQTPNRQHSRGGFPRKCGELYRQRRGVLGSGDVVRSGYWGPHFYLLEGVNKSPKPVTS